METLQSATQYEFMQPLVTGWLSRIDAAKKRAKDFHDTSEQCMAFFSGTCGFMWDQKYYNKFIGGGITPKFRLSLNKAFELVALFGPVLYHQNPARWCRPHPRQEYERMDVAEALGVPAYQYLELQKLSGEIQQAMQAGEIPPPELQQQVLILQQLDQEIDRMLGMEEAEVSTTRAACRLMERYLSYTPREQPNGGLEQAAEDAITELLIKGRGLLFPRPYRMPGSDRVLTGCFYESADNLLSDPDSKSVRFGEAMWITVNHLEPWWEVEKRFELPPRSLKGRGSLESIDAQVERRNSGVGGNLARQEGETRDLVSWWEVFSISGVGTRFSGMPQVLGQAFDEVVGDYAYIAVANGVPWPLNAPADKMRTASNEDVKRMFAWPVPYWADQRWPCAMLEVYREPGNPYPIAPLKPGLGELTFLNIVISALAHRMWQSSRTIVAVLESAKQYVEKALSSGGGDICVIGLRDIHQDINKVLSQFQVADPSPATFAFIDRIFEIFDKRTGLTDLVYALNPGGAASRSAEDIKAKTSAVSIRPDHMAKKVDRWMGEVAQLEKLCAYWSGVSGSSVRPLLGNLGATLWDRLIVQADPELVLREMDCTVEAGSAKKPDKARDAGNMSQLYQPLSQQFGEYAQITGDSGPLNELNKKAGEAIDMDLSGLEMGPWVPPPPPPGTPNPAEMEMAVEQQKLQAEHARLQMDQQSHVQELVQDQQMHEQEMQQREAEAKQKLKLDKAKAEAAARMKRLQAASKPKPK